mmetsp:Transcript_44266/g.53491  ORF Transcript_44266/g.53491 Transcript_44266/m.53491 type:complete len:107 (+) Transcript_44266:49-369(+)
MPDCHIVTNPGQTPLTNSSNRRRSRSQSRTTSGVGDTDTTTSGTFNSSRTESQVKTNGAIPPKNYGALPEEISLVARTPQPNKDSVGPLDGTRTANNRRFASLKSC